MRREVLHYNLNVILAAGYRVRSHRGTTFRQWATARLRDYLVTGFAMDDERLKNPPGPGQEHYFERLARTSMHMSDWIAKLDDFLSGSGQAGRVDR